MTGELVGLPLSTVVLIGAIVCAGLLVQSALGLGLGMLGAPLIALVEPTLVPTLLLLLAIPVSAGVCWVERDHVDWRVVGWSLPARLPGTVAGVWLVTAFSHRVLGAAVAVLVLVAVGFAVHAVEVRQTPGSLLGAGFASGVSGSAAAIGAPPMAIVLAHRPPRQARATLSFVFLVGAMMSATWFAVVGEMPAASLALAALFLPLLLVAFPLGRWAQGRLHRELFRRVVLGICAVSALVLLVRSVVV